MISTTTTVVAKDDVAQFPLKVEWLWLSELDVGQDIISKSKSKIRNYLKFAYRGIVDSLGLRSTCTRLSTRLQSIKDEVFLIKQAYDACESGLYKEDQTMRVQERLDYKTTKLLLRMDSLMNAPLAYRKSYIRVVDFMRLANAPYEIVFDKFLRDRDEAVEEKNKSLQSVMIIDLIENTVAYMERLCADITYGIDRTKACRV
jgi:hypothetical protein